MNKEQPTSSAPLVLYVYRCDKCGHRGQLHQPEAQPEVHTICGACGAAVVAEWDGGVVLEFNNSREKTE